ncbi:MAG: hypothetical protein GKR91_11985 [Pseudomonadales bacterium]|nr:hypothetical protein [Pseudomonadales bacterium]
MKNISHLILIIAFTVSSCSNDSGNSDIDISTQLETDSSQLFDLNNDGVLDVFYEFPGDEYYELVDRNFDTRVDESSRFSLDDILVSRRIDSNFDGFLETEIFYELGTANKITVDSDNNQLIDIVFTLEFGEILFAERFSDSQQEISEITKVLFEFGFPSGEPEITTTTLTASEFSELHD